mmetsp:Transcript_82724/g.208144  ORF Transcript_82724/g.208144 Transcript_82724/m.208144 type:complete len:228 (+) Transcript_82724:399-1082(+)
MGYNNLNVFLTVHHQRASMRVYSDTSLGTQVQPITAEIWCKKRSRRRPCCWSPPTVSPRSFLASDFESLDVFGCRGRSNQAGGGSLRPCPQPASTMVSLWSSPFSDCWSFSDVSASAEPSDSANSGRPWPRASSAAVSASTEPSCCTSGSVRPCSRAIDAISPESRGPGNSVPSANWIAFPSNNSSSAWPCRRATSAAVSSRKSFASGSARHLSKNSTALICPCSTA